MLLNLPRIFPDDVILGIKICKSNFPKWVNRNIIETPVLSPTRGEQPKQRHKPTRMIAGYDFLARGQGVESWKK